MATQKHTPSPFFIDYAESQHPLEDNVLGMANNLGYMERSLRCLKSDLATASITSRVAREIARESIEDLRRIQRGIEAGVAALQSFAAGAQGAA